jgi:hypothetical protein
MTTQFPVTDAAAEVLLAEIETNTAAGATAVNQAAANTSLATIATAQGAGGTGITEPAGGSGLLGWLSGIYKAITGTLTVSAASLPLPAGAATSANQPALNGDGGSLAHVTNFPATQAVTPTGATITDRSSSIMAGGTAQQLAAVNGARKGWRLQNTSSNDLWFNDTGSTASIGGAGCFKVASLGYYETPVGGASQAAISIYGATTAQTFSASEW